MMKTITLFLCCVLFLYCPLTSKESEKVYNATETFKGRFIVAPLIFYSPETSVGFGVAGSYLFHLGKGHTTHTSSISPLLIYTLKNQFRALVKSDLYFKNNNYRLLSEVKWESYPNKFYGIGNVTIPEDEELFTSKNLNFYASFFRRIFSSFSVGLHYHVKTWGMKEVEEGGLLAQGTIVGSADGTISGVGLLASVDTRDSVFYPRRGMFVEAAAKFYSESLGSEFAFSDTNINWRQYIGLFSNHVFALQTMVTAQSGDVPFLEMANLGGQYNMRGYFSGRFRDKNMLLIQTEYRVPISNRLGLVGFFSAGKVKESFSDLMEGAFNTAYGFGIRFVFDPREHINIRLDFGFGHDSNGIYFSIYEAF